MFALRPHSHSFCYPDGCWPPTGRRESLVFLHRYTIATALSLGSHGLLTAVGALINMPLWSYWIFWSGLALFAIWQRFVSRTIRQRAENQPRNQSIGRKLTWSDVLLITSVLVFAVAVYRTPRSNDIRQFVLQQQDMLWEQSFQTSAIGMTCHGVDRPMPRWRAHYWHVLPCVLSQISLIPVDQFVLLYGTIPIAATVLLSLWYIVARLSRSQRHLWIGLTALLLPILLLNRSVNAFNYSFRLTNNFWLDKDIALFFLIPTVLWMAINWLRGQKFYLPMLVLLIPAILRFHPMTAVYLVMLLPIFVIWNAGRGQKRWRGMLVLSAGVALIFIAVVIIGGRAELPP